MLAKKSEHTVNILNRHNSVLNKPLLLANIILVTSNKNTFENNYIFRKRNMGIAHGFQKKEIFPGSVVGH